MRVGIISDTHDQVENIARAVDAFIAANVDRIYHLGDWCSPFVLAEFKTIQCQIFGIFGNNDADVFKMTSIKPENIEFKDRFFVDEVVGKSVALLHGDPEELVTAVFESQRYDYLLCGHNHVAQIRKGEKTTLINPGSMLGPSRKHDNWTPPSVAILDLVSGEAEIRLLNES